jgi:dimethylamine corrinoid protein
MSEPEILESIQKAVYSGDIAGLKTLLQRRGADLRHDSGILEALSSGMEMARADLQNNVKSLPEFLFSVDAFRESVKFIRKDDNLYSKGINTVLIGVAEGEVHDLGKNIVSAVLDASGFDVVDLGRDVTRDMILDEIRKREPALLALSAMMSTCISDMQETISWVKNLFPSLKVIVGGAALDAELAKTIGAHGYAENASGAVDEAHRLIVS